jgi:hypothetical protein
MSDEVKIDGVRTQFNGAIPHEGEWCDIGATVTIIGKGKVIGDRADEQSNGVYRTLVVRVTEAEIAVVPPPPGLFDVMSVSDEKFAEQIRDAAKQEVESRAEERDDAAQGEEEEGPGGSAD